MSRERITGIDFEHGPEGFLGVFHPAFLKVDRAELEGGVGVVGFVIKRAMAAALGLVQLIERAKGAGQVIPRPRVIGLEANGAIQRIDGMLKLTELELQGAEVAPNFRLLGIEFNRAEITLQRGGEACLPRAGSCRR